MLLPNVRKPGTAYRATLRDYLIPCRIFETLEFRYKLIAQSQSHQPSRFVQLIIGHFLKQIRFLRN
jgi:hypothetical protein